MKNFKFYVLLFLAVIFSMTACQDDFSEEDFLNALATQGETKAAADHERRLEEIRLQAQLAASADSANQVLAYELQRLLEEYLRDLDLETDSMLAAKQLQLLQDAGLIVETFSLRIGDFDNEAVSGAVVSITDFGQGDAARTVSDTTNSDGVVVFNDMPVGFHTMNLTGTGYIGASMTVEFEFTNSDFDFYIGNLQYFAPRQESAQVKMFKDGSAGGTNTATIEGMAYIQTDLTSAPREYATGTVIRADLSDFTFSEVPSESSGIDISNYVLDDLGSGFAVATVDSMGMYSMTVPADPTGNTVVGLIMPTVVNNQILAYGSMNGMDMDDPVIDTLNASFGPNVSESSIPEVWGAKAVFDAPPAGAGEGFDFDLAPIGTGLDEYSLTLSSIVDGYRRSVSDFTNVDLVDYDIQMMSTGTGYTSTPLVAITDGGGSGAVMNIDMSFEITHITTTGGEGYDADADLVVKYVVEDWDFDSLKWDGPDTLTWGTYSATQTGGELEAEVDIADINYSPNSDRRVRSWFVEVEPTGADPTTAATASVVFGTNEIDNVRILERGSGYTSAPTVTVSGGGATSVATIEIRNFGIHYSLTPNNTGVTEDYTRVPEIVFSGLNNDGYNSTDITTSETVRFGEVIAGPGNASTTDAAEDLLEVVTGDLDWQNTVLTYVTNTRFTEEPDVLVKAVTSEIAKAGPIISGDGKVTDLEFYNWWLDEDTEGEGYMGPFNVTIMPSATGAPGSGAEIELTGGQYNDNGEWVYNGGYTVIDEGSGYVQNVNQASFKQFQVTGSIAWSSNNTWYIYVTPGDTFVTDIDFGTGERSTDVGDWNFYQYYNVDTGS